MIETQLLILLAALVLDWFAGEFDLLWRRTGHPVAWFGQAIGFLDRAMNRASDPAPVRQRNGAVAWAILVALALCAGWLAGILLSLLGPLGWPVEIVIVSVFVAQKSLKDHAAAVARALRADGIEGGRRAVAMIVGRDPAHLDRAGICRATIESVAENASDGVIAPALWYAVFGLPGLFAYKMINTADSMLGHRSETYLAFGRVSAQADDLANWLPARLSALLVAAGAWAMSGREAAKAALATARHDAGLHRSPNAGWPEAAFAGALGIALGGPRAYTGETVAQAWLNGAGRGELDAGDIDRALGLFTATCYALCAGVLVLAVLA